MNGANRTPSNSFAQPLPDRRLNRRAVDMASVRVRNPTGAMPQAFGNWPAAKGAYRFAQNKRVTPQHIHDAHRAKTARDVSGRHILATPYLDPRFLGFPAGFFFLRFRPRIGDLVKSI